MLRLRWLHSGRAAALALVLSSAGASADSLHIFSKGWSLGLQNLIPQQELMRYVVSPEEACREQPEYCGNTSSSFIIIPAEKLLEVMISGIRISAFAPTPQPDRPQPDSAKLHFSAPSGQTAVVIERISQGMYRIGTGDQPDLVRWFLANIDSMRTGGIAIERVEGLNSPASVEVLVPPQ